VTVQPPLAAIVEILDRAGIAYMVVGSFATAFHGHPRTTQDLDIVIDPTMAQLETLLAALGPDSYYVDTDVARDALRRRTMFNAIEVATAWKIDFVIRKDRPFSIEELRRRVVGSIDGVDAATATAEDTIIAKLEWAKAGGSERQLTDVRALLQARGSTLDLPYIEKWVTELGLDDVWQQARPSA
jgi:hypothetical protein